MIYKYFAPARLDSGVENLVIGRVVSFSPLKVRLAESMIFLQRSSLMPQEKTEKLKMDDRLYLLPCEGNQGYYILSVE